MSRLDEELKKEVESGYKAFDFIAKKAVIRCLLLVVVLGVFGFGYKYMGVNADRLIFKQSITYNEGVLDDLAKYKLEMIQSETEVEKRAIANLVVERFANYDETKIESNDLREFLEDCRNLDIENY